MSISFARSYNLRHLGAHVLVVEFIREGVPE